MYLKGVGVGEGGGGGGAKAITFKESMGINWNFQMGGGFEPKNLPWNGMDIFWNNTFNIQGAVQKTQFIS